MHPALIAAFGSLGSLAGTVSLALVWVLADVYLLGHVDPKFGPVGTVKTVLLIASVGGLAGAVGAYPAHWLLLKQFGLSRLMVPFLKGAAAGVGVALCLDWLLRLDLSLLPEVVGLIGVVALAGFVLTLLFGIFLGLFLRFLRARN